MSMEHDHSPEAIQARLSAEPRQTYLRDWVYGGIDGAVTTFAVVSGVIGAELSPGIVLVLGVANLVADGFSMAASNYAGTRTEGDELRYWEAVEHRHVDAFPEGEREEVRQIFRRKGLEGKELEHVVAAITADRGLWVRTMLAEEYGLPQRVRSPWWAALSTFSAFIVCGLAPLVPYAVGLPQAFWLAIASTAGVFFTIGAARSRWSSAPWWRSGLSTLGMGMTAAGLAYGIGAWLKTLL
jgi:VIT1/CCC1 family predicted Fe2+/Mn2+ transporter